MKIRPCMQAFIPELALKTFIFGVVGAGCCRFIQMFTFFRGYKEVLYFAAGLYLLCICVFLCRSFSEIFARYMVVSGTDCTLYTGILSKQQVHTSLNLVSGYEVNSNFIQRLMGYGDITIYFVTGYFTLRGVQLTDVRDLFEQQEEQEAIESTSNAEVSTAG